MKPVRILLILGLGVASAATSARGRPVDLSAPTGELGAANAKGYLEIWREVEEVGIDFGRGSFLPLRYRFSSDDNTGGILGPGFYMPMLEARSALIREQVMRAYLPCGKGLYLWQDSVDSTKFMSPDKEWTASVSGDDLTVWRDDGWTIVYHLGQLSSIRTDEGHVFNWDYDPATHMATGINKDGQPLVSVERNEQGLLGAVVINGKRFEMTYAQRPLTQILLGQPAIKELALALSSFKYPDGKSDTFKFVLSPQLVPSLTFTDLDQKQTNYTWDVATNHLATEQGPDGSWTYKIGDVAQPFGVPPISRTNAQGQMEGMAVDNQMGTYTQKGLGGVTTVTHVFETPGPLYHKVQRVEQIINGTSKLTYRASYDEVGNLIRSMDEGGYTQMYSYSSEGKLSHTSSGFSADLSTKLTKKEESLLNSISKAANDKTRKNLYGDLVRFYLFEEKSASKALACVPYVDPQYAYIFRVQAIDYDQTLSPSQKIVEYRKLLKQFPDRKQSLDFLIQARQEELSENTD